MRSFFNDGAENIRDRVLVLYTILLVGNLAAWLWALVSFRHFPWLLGTALLAYSFGLRHAVDADHIAAIDNVTRKLMQEGNRPVSAGFFFSLGHSTVVAAGSTAIAASALLLQHRLTALQSIGAAAGTLVSALFLFGIAAANLLILRSIYAVFVRVRAGGTYVEEDVNLLLADRGFLARFFRPLFALIQRSWHMYPLGILFGLGFDTATEIGILSIAAAEASKGLSFGSILVFPALFAAGMSLVDTTDTILMLGAYGWAFVKPVRKLYYNMTITFVSVLVALGIGGLEAMGLLAGRFHLHGAFWDAMRKANGNFSAWGFGVIGLFVLCWIGSIAFYKWRQFDTLAVQPTQP
jgi:high-affinity nickel-transport protein